MKNYQEIEDRELDDLFRKAHAETTVVPEFDQTFWSEMESLLPVQTGKKRIPVYFWWTSAAAILVVSAGVVLWILTDKNPDAYSNSVQNQSNHELLQKPVEVKDETADLDLGTADSESSNNTVIYLTLSQRRDMPDETPAIVREIIQTDKVNQQALEQDFERDPLFLSRKEFPFVHQTFSLKKSDPLMLSPQNDRYFIQLATGFGSSYQRAVADQNDLLFMTTLTGGVRTSVKQMELQAGISLRAEFVDNIIWTRNTNTVVNGQSILGVERFNARQLYSLEFPLALGWNGGARHNIVAQFVPGIQIAGYGTSLKEQESVVIAERRGVQNMNDSKTMTMELGLAYNYRIGMRHQLGVACNMDVIRPFNTSYYLGENRHFPMNVQISVRRYFSTGK